VATRYDNEYGYSTRVCDLVKFVNSKDHPWSSQTDHPSTADHSVLPTDILHASHISDKRHLWTPPELFSIQPLLSVYLRNVHKLLLFLIQWLATNLLWRLSEILQWAYFFQLLICKEFIFIYVVTCMYMQWNKVRYQPRDVSLVFIKHVA